MVGQALRLPTLALFNLDQCAASDALALQFMLESANI